MAVGPTIASASGSLSTSLPTILSEVLLLQDVTGVARSCATEYKLNPHDGASKNGFFGFALRRNCGVLVENNPVGGDAGLIGASALIQLGHPAGSNGIEGFDLAGPGSLAGKNC